MIWIEWHDLEMAPIGEFHGAKAKDKPQFIRPKIEISLQPILGGLYVFPGKENVYHIIPWYIKYLQLPCKKLT